MVELLVLKDCWGGDALFLSTNLLQHGSSITPEYCIKVLCLARLMLPKSDIRCAAGREVYFKGHEKTLFKIADSIFASGYLTEGGQSLEESFRTIEAAGFTWQLECA